MSKKKNDKLLISLSKYYIALIFTITIIFVVSYVSIALFIGKSLSSRKISFIDVLTSDNLDYEDIDIDQLDTLGINLEIIDKDGSIVRDIGRKEDGISIRNYTKEQLLNQVISSKKDSDYITIVNNIKYFDQDYFAVINVPRNCINVSIDIMRIPIKISKPIFIMGSFVVLFALILAMASIIIYSTYTAKRIKRPLDNISAALEKIAQGNYDEKITEDSVIEFAKIANTVNYLTEKLKSTNIKNKQLEESKSRMLLDLSHDIRTPITSIKGFSQALYEGMIDDEDTKLRYYKTIYLKSERVSELVNDLFELVRMDKMQYTLKIENVDICEYIRQIILSYYDEIEQKGFELEINIPEKPIMLRIDPKLYKRVIVNLIENSLKYNTSGTKLRVEVRDTNKFVVIEIADNGVGIQGEYRDKIFDAFVRADKSRNSAGGSGLGLAIAKKIVENHGGEILLLNPRADEKTIFYIKMYK